MLRLPVIPLFGPASQRYAGVTTFFCGNFGLIVINSAWTSKDNGRHALDLLERMVNVTMMRGAQSGGVITYCRSKRLPGKANPVIGVRSRVVNKKRTDLSKLIRAKVKGDLFDSFTHSFPSDGFVPFFSGHTRFATSSKATFDGTHPQRWTPPTLRRFYNFSIQEGAARRSRRHAFAERRADTSQAPARHEICTRQVRNLVCRP